MQFSSVGRKRNSSPEWVSAAAAHGDDDDDDNNNDDQIQQSSIKGLLRVSGGIYRYIPYSSCSQGGPEPSGKDSYENK